MPAKLAIISSCTISKRQNHHDSLAPPYLHRRMSLPVTLASCSSVPLVPERQGGLPRRQSLCSRSLPSFHTPDMLPRLRITTAGREALPSSHSSAEPAAPGRHVPCWREGHASAGSGEDDRVDLELIHEPPASPAMCTPRWNRVTSTTSSPSSSSSSPSLSQPYGARNSVKQNLTLLTKKSRRRQIASRAMGPLHPVPILSVASISNSCSSGSYSSSSSSSSTSRSGKLSYSSSSSFCSSQGPTSTDRSSAGAGSPTSLPLSPPESSHPSPIQERPAHFGRMSPNLAPAQAADAPETIKKGGSFASSSSTRTVWATEVQGGDPAPGPPADAGRSDTVARQNTGWFPSGSKWLAGFSWSEGGTAFPPCSHPSNQQPAAAAAGVGRTSFHSAGVALPSKSRRLSAPARGSSGNHSSQSNNPIPLGVDIKKSRRLRSGKGSSISPRKQGKGGVLLEIVGVKRKEGGMETTRRSRG